MARRAYTAEFHDEVVEYYKLHGVNATLRQYPGLSKESIYRWSDQRGVDKHEVTGRLHESTERAIKRGGQARRKKVEEALDRRVDGLLALSEIATARELKILLTAGDNLGIQHMREVTMARHRSTRDLLEILGRAGEKAAEETEILAIVRTAIGSALMDAGLTHDQQDEVRRAFARRLRMHASGEEPIVPEEYAGDDDEPVSQEVAELAEFTPVDVPVVPAEVEPPVEDAGGNVFDA